MNEKIRAHAALIGANLIYGVTYAVAKQVIPGFMSPFALVMARILGAGILFWITGLMVPREKIARKDRPRIFIASIFGVALNQSLFLNGLNLTSPIDAAIIMTGVPILVLVVARIILGEPITSFKLIGIAAGATGAILLITYSGRISFGNEHTQGNLMIVGNATSYAVYLVIVKPLLSKYPDLASQSDNLEWLTTFSVEIRYPGESAIEEDARQAVTIMESVITLIIPKIS